MLFESRHSLSENEFIISKGTKLNFPIHIHRSFEYFEQVRGSTKVCIGDQTYVLKDGEAVLVFPLQPHSYNSIKDGEIRMCIFSPDIVAEFYKNNESNIPTENKFICSLPENLILENLFHKKSREKTRIGFLSPFFFLRTKISATAVFYAMPLLKSATITLMFQNSSDERLESRSDNT